MIKRYNKILLKVSKGFEITLSIGLLIIVLFGMMDLARSVYSAYIIDFAHPVKYSQLNGFLAEALLLVIGIELVVMLSLHMPGALLEVLLYAIARKLILLPTNSGMIDLLIGIFAIGCIFAIKRYLLNDQEKKITLSRLYDHKKIQEYEVEEAE